LPPSFSDALKDFEELSLSGVERNDVANTPDSQERPDESGPTTFQTSEDNWTEDFLKQTAEQFEKNLQNLLQNGELTKRAVDVNLLLRTFIVRR